MSTFAVPSAGPSVTRFSAWSLTAKLTLAATVLCVLCVGTVSSVIGWQMSDMARDDAAKQADLAANEVAVSVAGELGSSFSTVQAYAATLQGMKQAGRPPSRDQLDDMSRQVLQDNTEFIGTYSIWEPNALDGLDAEYVNHSPAYDATGRYIAYWNRGSGAIAVEPLLDYEKPGANDWYDIPRRTGKPALIEPYLYPVAGKDVLMATIAVPVMVEGRFVGMAGSDLPLMDLSARLSRLQPMPESRVALLSAGGLYVAVHESERLARQADDLPPQALSHIAQGQPYQYEDEQGWVHLFRPVQVAEGVPAWSVRVSYPVSAAMAQAREALAWSVAVALLACALAAGAMVWLVRHLMRPLRQLSLTMQGLAGAQADLRARLDDHGGHDELAVIARSFNQFIARIAQVFEVVQRNADGVAVAGKEIAQGNMDLSSRTEQQASALQETAASMDQLSQTVRQNAENAQTANQLADQASTVAREGGQVMAQVVSTMHDIHESSKRISDIIGTIDGIAFQTNILALNAAVEAARAGEQGRGFAVVASEVRSLASRSAEAAKAIKGLISASVEKVETGSTLVDQAGRTMTDVVDSIQRVNQIVGEISAASHEQADGVGHVNAAVTDMDRTTQQNAALVEQMAAASSSLRGQADELLRAVSTFEQPGR